MTEIDLINIGDHFQAAAEMIVDTDAGLSLEPVQPLPAAG
jgi:hypothetical protein